MRSTPWLWSYGPTATLRLASGLKISPPRYSALHDGSRITVNPIFIIALVVLVVIAAGFLQRKAGSTAFDATSAYSRCGPLATPTELAFLNALEPALDPDQRAFMKVRLGDVVAPKRARNEKGHFAALNRVTAKHLDYVVCDRASTQVLYAIELNDKSHDRADRAQRDKFVLEAMASAGVPLIVFQAARSYSTASIRARLEEERQRP